MTPASPLPIVRYAVVTPRTGTLAAHFVAVEDGAKLRIATDAAGTDLWQTPEEAERAAKEAALARVPELEAALAQRGA